MTLKPNKIYFLCSCYLILKKNNWFCGFNWQLFFEFFFFIPSKTVKNFIFLLCKTFSKLNFSKMKSHSHVLFLFICNKKRTCLKVTWKFSYKSAWRAFRYVGKKVLDIWKWHFWNTHTNDIYILQGLFSICVKNKKTSGYSTDCVSLPTVAESWSCVRKRKLSARKQVCACFRPLWKS